MSWLKLDDGFADHPKVLELSDGAFRLHVRAMCWCARQETDGKLTMAALKALGAKSKQVAELVSARLWLQDGCNHEVKDFLVYNPSRAQQEAERAATRQRQQRFRERNAVTPTDPVTPLLTHLDGSVTNAAPTRPDPTRDQIQPEPSSQRPDRSEPAVAPATTAPPPELSGEFGEFEKPATVCPLDLYEKADAAGLFVELAQSLGAGLPELRHHAAEFVTYWTVSKGMGRKKRHWMRELRGRLCTLHHEKKLVLPSGPRKADAPPPGLTEHEKQQAEWRRAEAKKAEELRLKYINAR